jgi:hypothetical protein
LRAGVEAGAAGGVVCPDLCTPDLLINGSCGQVRRAWPRVDVPRWAAPLPRPSGTCEGRMEGAPSTPSVPSLRPPG